MAGRPSLSLYVNEHLLGAAAGLEMFRHAARTQRGTEYGPDLARLAEEVAQDRAQLVDIARRLGLPALPGTGAAGRLLDLAGRLRPGPRLLAGGPLTTLLQLEMLELGVRGKGALWLALLEVQHAWPGLDADQLAALADRAQRQAAELEGLRRRAAAAALTPA